MSSVSRTSKGETPHSNLARQLVTANPSPRYVRAIARAFLRGEHGGRVYSGRPADLGAAVAATLLNREAADPALDHDPRAGGLREPLLKLVHLMRALDFRPAPGRLTDLKSLDTRLGQRPLRAPSVFSYYLPTFQPTGRVAATGLVSPVAEILDGPSAIHFLNGALALLANGLDACVGGFGAYRSGSCADSRGDLAYAPRSEAPELAGLAPADAAARELDVLLTAGRASAATLAAARAAYGAGDADAALRRMQMAFLAAPEFHATGALATPGPAATPPPTVAQAGTDADFRAVVVLYLAGGADSYSVLVPHSNCTGGADLYAKYATARSGVDIAREALLPVDDAGGTQPCRTFGLHPSLARLAALYGTGDAALVANIGQLHELLHGRQVCDGQKRPPSGAFGHNSGSFAARRVAGTGASCGGVLSRLASELELARLRSGAFSLAGLAGVQMLEGGDTVDVIDPRRGTVPFAPPSEAVRAGVMARLANHTTALHAEVYADVARHAIARTKALNPKPNTRTTLATPTWHTRNSPVAQSQPNSGSPRALRARYSPLTLARPPSLCSRSTLCADCSALAARSLLVPYWFAARSLLARCSLASGWLLAAGWLRARCALLWLAPTSPDLRVHCGICLPRISQERMTSCPRPSAPIFWTNQYREPVFRCATLTR